MSDFSHTAKCPGCGQRFAPDDGMCCVPCNYCGQWSDWDMMPVGEDGFVYVCDNPECMDEYMFEHPEEDDE